MTVMAFSGALLGRRFLDGVVPLGEAGPDGPLAQVVWRQRRKIPFVVVLGLLTSLLEAISLGLLIPLISTLAGVKTTGDASTVFGRGAELADQIGGRFSTEQIAGVILLLTFVKALAQSANAALVSKIDSDAGQEVRAAAAGRLLELDYVSYLIHDPSRFVKVLTMDLWHGMETMRARLEVLVATTCLAVFAAALLFLSWRLSLVVLVLVLLVRWVQHMFERRLREISGRTARINEGLGQQMLTLVGAARTIRLFGGQKVELDRFTKVSDAVRASIFRGQALAGSTTPLIELLLVSAILAILVVGALSGWQLATVSVFLLMLYRALPHLTLLSRARVTIAARKGELDSIQWLLGLPQETRERHPEKGPAPSGEPIEFRAVSYTYPNGYGGLTDASFAIETGRVTALLGASGAGKSTVVNLLCGLLQPTSGAIAVGERELRQIAAEDWLPRLAIAGQDIDLFPGTVASNIAYGSADASLDEIVAAARAAGADGFIGRLPDGYDSYVGENGISLSAGQRQRIGIARALLRRPELLIFDEATSAIDALAESEIVRLFEGRRFFHTALVISHRLGTLINCQNGIVLEDGKVVETGPIASLRYLADIEYQGS